MTTFQATLPAAQSAPAAHFRLLTGPVQFLGFERDYWRLLIWGSVLLAVTLGIYRFWLTTDMRRFLWSNSEVLGEPLEYTGTARELLIGFLIAIAVLIPFYTGIFLLALQFHDRLIGQLAGVIGFVLATVLGQFAVFRARRYRLTHTVYRGVRFHQTGSAWHYALLAVVWWTIVILTLGLAYPIAQARLERFKMRNTWLGNLQGRFEGSAAKLFIRGSFMWLVIVGPLVASLVAMVALTDMTALLELAGGDEETLRRFGEAHPGVAAAFGFAIAALVWTMLAGLLLYPVFQAMVLRWWASGLRFGEMAASSDLRTGEVYGTYLRYIGWSIVFSTIGSVALVIVFAAIAAGLKFTGALENERISEYVETVGIVSAVGVYVIFALAYAAIYQVKVKLGLWRAIANSTGLSNPAPLETISSIGAPASAVGEGLADALNVGGF